MQKKINIMFLLCLITLTTFLTVVGYDTLKQHDELNTLRHELAIQSQGMDLIYQTTYGVYRIAKPAYMMTCSGDRQFKFDCLLEDPKPDLSWKEDLITSLTK